MASKCDPALRWISGSQEIKVRGEATVLSALLDRHSFRQQRDPSPPQNPSRR